MTKARIKICGLTRREDITCVNALLPDYVGFVFATSKRSVSVEQATKWVALLDPRIQSVGVFVDAAPSHMVEVAKQVRLDVLQLHGHESPHTLQHLRKALPHIQIWKAHRITGLEPDSRFATPFDANLHLIDTLLPNACMGGAGIPFDWATAHYLKNTDFPFMLAGGLTPLNVSLALQTFHPFGVDVSSGVESNGLKDPEKIQSFIHTVRNFSTDSDPTD